MTVAEAGCGLKEGHNARSQSATQSGGNIQPHHFVRRPLSTLLGPSGSCGQDHVLLDYCRQPGFNLTSYLAELATTKVEALSR